MDEYTDKSNEQPVNENQNQNQNPNIQKRTYNKKQNNEQIIKDANAQLMNGAMLLTFCDFLFPGLMLFMFKKFSKDKYVQKIEHNDIVLKDRQIESLEKVSDAAAQVIFEKVNPLVLFFLAINVMYYMNYKMALDNKKREGGEK